MFGFNNRTIKRLSGFTTLEFLLSITLGVVVLGVMLEIFIATKERQVYQTALNELEANATRTISILHDDIKRAGHIGCARLTRDFPLYSFIPNFLTLDNRLIGKSHEITVRYADLPGAIVKRFSQKYLLVSNDIIFKAGDVLLISDCKKAEIFKIKSAKIDSNQQLIEPERPLRFSFNSNAEIGRMVSNQYYLANDASGKHLYRKNIKGHKILLIDNITNISFKYMRYPLQALPHLNSMDAANEDANEDDKPLEPPVIIGVDAEINVVEPPLANKKWYMYVALPK